MKSNKRITPYTHNPETEILFYDQLIENAYQGMVMVNETGHIIKCRYEKLLGIKEADVLGKHITEIIENTRLHHVLNTGKAEIGDIQMINGHDMIASRVPVYKGKEIIGVIGTIWFKDIKEVITLGKRLEKLENKVSAYREAIGNIHEAKYRFEDIVTQNKSMIAVINMARRASKSKSTVLIEGQSGTGKEYFAHAIHNASSRKYAPFIRINCSAIPKELFESELFGYSEGAFTGAKKSGKLGKLELAHHGTILLDEIGMMPLDMQAKLLRVLEEREFERVGGNQKIKLDIRVIASTNENLKDLVHKKRFREDLYYRLNVVNIKLPPLNARLDDIPLLSNHILRQFLENFTDGPTKITDGVLKVLKQYTWPGNVRELRNVIERAINLASGDVIYSKDLPDYVKDQVPTRPSKIESVYYDLNLKSVVEQAERNAIADALISANGNRTKAAELLGIHRTLLYKKMDKLGI